MRFETGGIDLSNGFPFFSGAVRVVAQRGQSVGGLSPHGLENGARGTPDFLGIAPD